jgi:hypothetical protein
MIGYWSQNDSQHLRILYEADKVCCERSRTNPVKEPSWVAAHSGPSFLDGDLGERWAQVQW